jgi:hypothetical protein
LPSFFAGFFPAMQAAGHEVGMLTGRPASENDADLAIWDPEWSRTVKSIEGQSNADYTLYEDWTVTGWPVTTISRSDLPGRADYGRAGPWPHGEVRSNHAPVGITGSPRRFPAA